MRYDKEKICAVIVTYHCTEILVQNVEALLNQVGHILIVDNNSDEKSKMLISSLIKQHVIVSAIFNNTNHGVAFALNQGLDWAFSNGYNLLLTMDQDAIMDDRAVRFMLDTINGDEKIVSVGPSRKKIKKSNRIEKVSYLITAGNLIRVDKLKEIKGYDTGLFIDCVDFDVSLSLRDRGGILYKDNRALMIHRVGEKEEAKFLMFKFSILSHAPVRHYYISRNHVYLLKKHFKKHKIFCIKKQIIFTLYVLNILLFQYNKKEKIAMIIHGFQDAKHKKNGPYFP